MKTEKEVNNVQHGENTFSEVIEHGLKHGGIHLVSVKGHGKTRLLFGMARTLRQKARVLIFDGSLAWLYGFDKIPVFTIKERDIVAKKIESIDEIERYKIKNWELVKLSLQTHKDILFRLKTRKPSKRGFFIRQVVNYLDALQRQSREATIDHEASQYISYFIEEAQNCFNSRSTTRLEAEEFLSVFNESRNQKEAFYSASQRLTDFSKTIRTKQTYVIGKIPEEDKSPSVRRLEKKYNVDYSKTESRTWNFEGKPFESPNWKQNGKPFQINKQIKLQYIEQLKPISVPLQPQIKKPLLLRILDHFSTKLVTPTITTTIKRTEDENDLQYYNVYGNTEEDELDALDEEEGEDLWF